MGRVAARGLSSHAAARYPHSAAIWGAQRRPPSLRSPLSTPPPKKGAFWGGAGITSSPRVCFSVASFVSVSTFACNSTLLKHSLGCVKAVQNWLNQRKNRCLVAKSFFVQHSMCCWCSQVFLHYTHIVLTHTHLCVSHSLLRCEIGNVNFCLNHVQSVAPLPPAPIASAPPPPSTLAVSFYLFCVRAFVCACVCTYLCAGVCMCVCVRVLLAPITIFPPSPSASNAVVSACVRACVRACVYVCMRCVCGCAASTNSRCSGCIGSRRIISRQTHILYTTHTQTHIHTHKHTTHTHTRTTHKHRV